MTLVLPTLYHWSPAERHHSILDHGLKVYQKPTVQSGHLRWPYICLGFTPSGAHSLSVDIFRSMSRSIDPPDEWDLWQVHLPENADATIRPERGQRVYEVKVYTAIPPSDMWWVARRTEPHALEPGQSR